VIPVCREQLAILVIPVCKARQAILEILACKEQLETQAILVFKETRVQAEQREIPVFKGQLARLEQLATLD
jgi:hypothetical protein